MIDSNIIYAEALFSSGITALPNNAKLHYNLAHVTCKGVSDEFESAQVAGGSFARRAKKKWNSCKKLYEEAVRLSPDFQEVSLSL